ncbi:MAG TPA: ATP-binding cassette domain-containing protein, partial [Tabrizicola sp.]|nr:ATP-binding cassette domain-containing protein [Tabrizicola sp.]
KCPHDLGTDLPGVDRRSETLSGGEQQAVMIGRAIHFGGDLLVMDEPTSALSIRETDKVLGYVQNARDNLGKSVVFITHIIRHIYPIADRFVVLWKGEKIADIRRDQIDRKDLENLVINGPA